VPAVLLAAPGCLTLDQFVTGKGGAPRSGNVCQIVTTWNPRVEYVPDSVHGGVPAPCMVGRLYLFGPNIDFPLVGDGDVVVELFDDGANAPQGVKLEDWHFTASMLKQLLRKDTIGWGYSLVLPWGSYRPDLRHVHLTCRYEQPKGGPLYAPPSPVSLDHGSPPAGAAVPVSMAQLMAAQTPMQPLATPQMLAPQMPVAPNALAMPRPVQ